MGGELAQLAAQWTCKRELQAAATSEGLQTKMIHLQLAGTRSSTLRACAPERNVACARARESSQL